MFVNGESFALLITWTCYGTWLPGDRRGYVSNTRRSDGKYDRKRNVPGSPITADHAATRQHAAAHQKYATAALDRDHAAAAAYAICDSCAVREWRVLRAALMWNHVHVIVSNCPDDGPEVRRVLKGVSQNAICKHDGKSQRWWTAGGSDRYLHGERAIAAATNYVASQPGVLVEIVNMIVMDPSERRGLSPPK